MNTADEKQLNLATMILVIDDRPDQRSLFSVIGGKLGIGVHPVGSWTEAEAALETVAFDAILMDVQMPDIDGIEATKRLREQDRINGRYTPVIAVTARAMDGDREECLSAGMDDYLSKPFTIDELRSVILRWARQAKEA